MTALLIDGVLRTFEPVQLLPELPETVLGPGSVEFDELVRLATSGHSANPTWGRTSVHSKNRFIVTIIGTSSTNGCGSSESFHASRCAHQGTPDRLCSQRLSWVRHFHDELQVTLNASTLVTRVHPRNAVVTSYFARCTSRFVSADTDAILLELGQAGSLLQTSAELPQLVAAIRRIAPMARLVLLTWTQQHAFFAVNETRALETAELSARALGVDVFRMDRIALTLMRHHALAHSEPSCRRLLLNLSRHGGLLMNAQADLVLRTKDVGLEWLYAQRGLDAVHPSPEGSVLHGNRIDQILAASSSYCSSADLTLPLVSDLSTRHAGTY